MRQNLLLDDKLQGLIREMNVMEKNQNKLKAENFQVIGKTWIACTNFDPPNLILN